MKPKSMAVALVCLLCTACAVNTDEIKTAAEVCESNGGLKWIYAFPTIYAHCENGVAVKNLHKRGT